MPIVCHPLSLTCVLVFYLTSVPKANKLSTVKKCLNEVLKYGGPFTPRDLYPVRVLSFQSCPYEIPSTVYETPCKERHLTHDAVA